MYWSDAIKLDNKLKVKQKIAKNRQIDRQKILQKNCKNQTKCLKNIFTEALAVIRT